MEDMPVDYNVHSKAGSVGYAVCYFLFCLGSVACGIAAPLLGIHGDPHGVASPVITEHPQRVCGKDAGKRNCI